ncbi:GumC family protein [Pseudomonas oryzihabitans]|uniref:GumC family protein n=1 Tax=Pseudomonas oryzihabitans TaxID=47885 RepID=UPI00111E0706|nr:Wzz/FepE/Etk N-terminal domain-containing protein [Pseudomonas psychrotolerans]QDD88712.1 lipopolysaccharide biosynthesis protein [Pseudomonas psychrotolerans]
MNKMENYLHEFLRVFFANSRLIKRVFLVFTLVTLALALLLPKHYDISGQVIVQSKKLSQSDPNGLLTPDADKYLPLTLADMETESDILRSPTLIRSTLAELVAEGHYQLRPTLVQRLFVLPLKTLVITPLRSIVIDPLHRLLGGEPLPPKETLLDEYTADAIKNLKIATLPGSNVISVDLKSLDPAQGTLFVDRLLHNYLERRRALQSNDLPETFYEKKKAQYGERLNALESQRIQLLQGVNSVDPTQETTFRLNAISTEEAALNTYRDNYLEGKHWLEYLEKNLIEAKKRRPSDYAFPFSFTNTVNGVAYQDSEIKQLGDQLIQQISRYGNAAEVFQPDSVPMQQQRAQIDRTHQEFLKIVANRIRERQANQQTLQAVIDQKTARIDEYKARVRQLQDIEGRLRQLDTEIDALHKAFFTYTQRYEESRDLNLIESLPSNARILSNPQEPTQAAFPRPFQVVLLGLLTGLLLAIALGYIREFFDHRFKHPNQIQQHLNLPVLMVLNSQRRVLGNPYRRGSLRWLWHCLWR